MKMSYEEFKRQERHCRRTHAKCDECSGNNNICADNIRNIMGKAENDVGG